MPEARFVASLCGDADAKRQWLAKLSDTPQPDTPTTLPALGGPTPEHYAAWHAQMADGLAKLTPDELAALDDEVAERAAIMEYNGGLDRDEAERRAEWQTLWLRFCAPQAATSERMAA
jgi:hypothetical protein